jgi:hypothetical protein
MFENKCKGKKWHHIKHHFVFDVSLGSKLNAFDALFRVIGVFWIVLNEKLHQKISEIHYLNKIKYLGKVFNFMIGEPCINISMVLVTEFHIIPECSKE